MYINFWFLQKLIFSQGHIVENLSKHLIQGSNKVLEVLNCKIGFQDLKKY